MSEEWRPIPGYEGLYEAGSEGRIRSLDRVTPSRRGLGYQRVRGRILKPNTNWGNGRKRVTLSIGGRKRLWLVHVLVLTAFVGERPEGMFGLHNDGNHLNNRVDNLRWGTPSDNSQDCLRHGTHWQLRKTHCPQGHPFNEANTWVRSTGARRCRTCHRESQRKRSERKRAQARGAA